MLLDVWSTSGFMKVECSPTFLQSISPSGPQTTNIWDLSIFSLQMLMHNAGRRWCCGRHDVRLHLRHRPSTIGRAMRIAVVLTRQYSLGAMEESYC